MSDPCEQGPAAMPVPHGVREQFLQHQVQSQAMILTDPGLGAERLQKLAQRAQPVQPGMEHRGM